MRGFYAEKVLEPTEYWQSLGQEVQQAKRLVAE